jgi:hypothetical protein
MTQLLAAVFVVVFGAVIMGFVSYSAKKPYDGYDFVGVLFGLGLTLLGICRVVWLAFS